MQRLTCLLALLLTITAACGSGKAAVKFSAADRNSSPGASTSLNFERDPAGTVPSGAEVFSGKWEVRANEGGVPSAPNSLCQTANAEFPAILLDSTVYTDVDVTTRFKAISGTVDQAAGIIVRIQDKDNFYILRANSLENNVNLYKYTGGSRKGIKDGKVPVSANEWHDLRFEASGKTLRGYLDGKLVVEANDETFQAGKTGLWTKADSVTCFDNFTVKAP